MISGSAQKTTEFTVAPADLQKHCLTDENRQRWVFIQLNTFTNWLNEQLVKTNTHIDDLSTDLSDGIVLIQIVETLQQRICTGKIYNSDPTEIQMIMNVQMALDALKKDGVKMVNIGAHDIVEGNLKLILGLVWCLIQHYQIDSNAKIPAKKLMMAWLQSVLPELRLTNFRTNWNDGKALAALLNYCQPGLCPNWKNFDSKNDLENCKMVLMLAEEYLSVPSIISPSDLSSPDLDELSTITYLSYFMKYNGPGYQATLRQIRQLLPDIEVEDFEECWKDGFILANLVNAVGGQVEDFERIAPAQSYSQCVSNIQKALDAANRLGITSLVGAEDLADPKSDHLGVMALAAALASLLADSEVQVTQCYQNEQVNLGLAFSEGNEVDVNDFDVVVIGPGNKTFDKNVVQLQKKLTADGAVLSVVPVEAGFHK
uniref:Calponin-homology (CH) domain-containing protein n=1 Tax=Syphacia muris TaxID=451379 RepID=A0A0N5B0E1_9BILA